MGQENIVADTLKEYTIVLLFELTQRKLCIVEIVLVG